MGFLKQTFGGVGKAVGSVAKAPLSLLGGLAEGMGIDTEARDPLAGYRDEMLAKARKPIETKSDPGVEAMRKRLALLGNGPTAPAAHQMSLERGGGGPRLQQGPIQEFQAMRDQQIKRINQQANTDSQNNQDALTRRFSRMGGLNSGAFIKQTQLSQEAMDRSKADQIQDAASKLDLAEAQERQRRNEFETQRFDAKEESLLSRNFGRESANMNARIDADAKRMDAEFKNRVFQADNESKIAQLDLAHKNMQLEKDAQEFNKLVAAIEAGNPQGLIGSMFGPGGVPGLSKLPMVGGLFR